METKTQFRTKVFKRAYEIMRITKKAFAVCLSKAWALYRLNKKLKANDEDEVVFTYEKKDGTLRRAYGTLKNVSQFVKGTIKTHNKCISLLGFTSSRF